MIQRIQSLYILVATVLIALTLFLPLMEYISADGDCQFHALGFMQGDTTVLSTIPLFILLSVAAFFNAVTLFSFKKRILQIRLLVFSIVLQIGSYGLSAYYIFQIKNTFTSPVSYAFPVTFPVVSAILSFLAIRAIGKDEALVKSLDRIR